MGTRYKNIIMVFGIFHLIVFATGCKETQNLEKSTEEKAQNNVYLQDVNVGGKSKSELEGILRNMAVSIDTPPKDDAVDGEKAEAAPETIGKRLNIEGTLNAILTAKEGQKIEPIVENINPEISGGDKKNQVTKDSNNGLIEIGSFSTSLLDDQNNRVENLHIAADCLNDEKIMPGEEFSFNGTIGRRTEGKGYKKAPIIKRTKDGPKKGYGVGGGICQLSSTLYNATEKAGLKITERHHHSKKVGYVPEGKDATVVYGSKDFKFKNNRSNPIVIKASVSNGKVAVSLYEMIK